MNILDNFGMTIRIRDIGLIPYTGLALKYLQTHTWFKWLRPKGKKEYNKILIQRQIQVLNYTIETGIKLIERTE